MSLAVYYLAMGAQKKRISRSLAERYGSLAYAEQLIWADPGAAEKFLERIRRAMAGGRWDGDPKRVKVMKAAA